MRTEGEWKSATHNYRLIAAGWDGQAIVANVYHDRDLPLIIAAPKLLEALRDLLEVADDAGLDSPACHYARLIIADATKEG